VRNPGWTPGIRVGSLRDGQPMYFITGNVEAYPNGSNPEGVAVDAAGNVYGAVVSEGGAFLKSADSERNTLRVPPASRCGTRRRNQRLISS